MPFFKLPHKVRSNVFSFLSLSESRSLMSASMRIASEFGTVLCLVFVFFVLLLYDQIVDMNFDLSFRFLLLPHVVLFFFFFVRPRVTVSSSLSLSLPYFGFCSVHLIDIAENLRIADVHCPLVEFDQVINQLISKFLFMEQLILKRT